MEIAEYGGSQDQPPFDANCKFAVPKSIPSFDSKLEGTQNLLKAVLLLQGTGYGLKSA